MSDSDVFIASFHGGLGDSLQFSTLPEEFYKQKGRKTYVWGGATFRNQEIYDLVWGANPYVHGVKDGEWNAGDLPTIEYSNVAEHAFLIGNSYMDLNQKISFQKFTTNHLRFLDFGTIFW